MSEHVALIGFGEAGMAFAEGLAVPAAVYDRKTDADADRRDKLADYARLRVEGAMTNRAATHGARLVLSLVTAGHALAAARETARWIAPGALFCDMNSVAPETKRRAAEAIGRAGGSYVDVAVMAPVRPAKRGVPLLICGSGAAEASAALAAIGFGNMRVVPGGVGKASAIKMIRSVLVKGLEALTTECVLAADRAGVLDEVIMSLNASWPGADWAAKADYNLERMMVHGVRRAEEMEEVVKTLDALGTGAAMSRGTAECQRAVGRMGLDPSQPLAGKIGAVLGRDRRRAA